MSLKYPLDQLNDSEFEGLTVSICRKILGIGTIGFTAGKDGGRDGRFSGTAQSFPSTAVPWAGKFIIQAKHTNAPYASCSDTEFQKIVEAELPKIQKLKAGGELDYYLLFTNRRLTGQKDADIRAAIKKETGVEAFLAADNTIQDWLIDFPAVAKANGLLSLLLPFEFYEKDICDVIQAFPDSKTIQKALDDDRKWLYISKDEKNRINKLTHDYFTEVLLHDVKDFDRIKYFLEDPANSKLKDKYDATVYELQAQIMTYKAGYETFDEIFTILYEFIVSRNQEALLPRRRLVRLFLHYMYFICDIGKKEEDKA
jgi:hypothetical protein